LHHLKLSSSFATPIKSLSSVIAKCPISADQKSASSILFNNLQRILIGSRAD
jgi:hypothetical protein